MTSIISYQIFIFFLFISLSIEYNLHFKTSLLKSLIQRRQLLDGTAKNDGVSPKPPGSDSSFNQNFISYLTQQTILNHIFPTITTTTIIIKNDLVDDRSIKDTSSSNSKSKASLIASILAPTGILGLIGSIIGILFYKNNQTNSSINDTKGFFSKFFNKNSNGIIENKLEEKYLLVGNIS
ncbi:unnamed protein product [Rotaria sordida]|uniref:Uncharacterized protein n=2 Tax=Rotaria sordida TaxID=392033 RepID=A0A819CHQ3_9BILA|nr:unnamed protein product [Rotaria sordida]